MPASGKHVYPSLTARADVLLAKFDGDIVCYRQVGHLLDSLIPLSYKFVAASQSWPCIDVPMLQRKGAPRWIRQMEPPANTTSATICKLQEALITGDAFHNPIQFVEPKICSMQCADKEMSRKTWREFLARYENKPVRMFAVHFNYPAGWILRDARNWRFSTEQG
jgi:TPP-dependent trihydroxycyclohexane-1,2-dione (THcHDO) dehydratase